MMPTPPASAPPAPAEPKAPMSVEPPPEGYTKRAIKEIADGLQTAMSAIAKAAKTEAGEVPEVTDDLFEKGHMMMPLPPWLIENVCTIIQLADQLGGKMEGRYAVDCLALLATEEGVRKLGTLLDLIAKDKVLLQKIADTMRAKATMPPKTEKVEETEEVTTDVETPANAEQPKIAPTAYM